jgi:hypothetical protein
MRKLIQFKAISLIAMALLFTTVAFGQKKMASPPDTAKGTVAGAAISIAYHSPSIKGRKVLGGLVPYDKVWRVGANEATIFTTSKDIKIGDKTLPAGKYSLYSIAGKDSWKVIFNSKTGQWGINMDGSTTDDPAKDVLVTTVKPVKSGAKTESFTIKVTATGFAMLWDDFSVPVTIK